MVYSFKYSQHIMIPKIFSINVGQDIYIHRPDVIYFLGAEVKFPTGNLTEFFPQDPYRKKNEKTLFNQIKDYLEIFERKIASIGNTAKWVILFPELSVPLSYKHKEKKVETILEEFSKKHCTVIICGCMYENAENDIKNFAKIFIPNEEPQKYEYIKCYLSKYEYGDNKYQTKIIQGDSIPVFKNTPIGDFAVMLCSDYEQTAILDYLRGKIDILFVLGANPDQKTYLDRARALSKNLYYFQVLLNTINFGESGVYGPFQNQIDGRGLHGRSEFNSNYEEFHKPQNLERLQFIEKPLKIGQLRKKVFSELKFTKLYVPSLSEEHNINFSWYDDRKERILLFPDWLNRLLFFEEVSTCETKKEILEFFDHSKYCTHKGKDEILEAISEAFLYQFETSDSTLDFAINRVNSLKLKTMQIYEKAIKLLGFQDYYHFSILKITAREGIVSIINYAIATLLYCFSTTRLANLFENFSDITEIYEDSVRKLDDLKVLLQNNTVKEKFQEELNQLISKSEFELIYGFIEKLRCFDNNIEKILLSSQNTKELILDRLNIRYDNFITLLEGYFLYYSGRLEELKLNNATDLFYRKLSSKSLLEISFEKITAVHDIFSNNYFCFQLEKKLKKLNNKGNSEEKHMVDPLKNLLNNFNCQIKEIINFTSNRGKIGILLNQYYSKIETSKKYEDAIEKFNDINAPYRMNICKLQIEKRKISKLLVDCHSQLKNNQIESFLKKNKEISNCWREISEIRQESIGELKGKSHDYFFKVINRVFGKEIKFLSLVAPYILKEAVFSQREVKFQLYIYSTSLKSPIIYSNIIILLPKAFKSLDKIQNDLLKLDNDPRIQNSTIKYFIRENLYIYSRVKVLIYLILNKKMVKSLKSSDEILVDRKNSMDSDKDQYYTKFKQIIQDLIYEGLLQLFKFEYHFALKYFTLIWICMNIIKNYGYKDEDIKYYVNIAKILFNMAVSKVENEKYEEVINENKEILNLIPSEEEAVRNFIEWFNNLIEIFYIGQSKHWDVIPDENHLDNFRAEIKIQKEVGENLQKLYSTLDRDFLKIQKFLDNIDDKNLNKLKKHMGSYLEIQYNNRFGWSTWKKGSLLLYNGKIKEETRECFDSAKNYFERSQKITSLEYDNEYKRRSKLLQLEIFKFHLFKFKSKLDNLKKLKKNVMDKCLELREIAILQGNFINYLTNNLQKRIFSLIFNWIELLIDPQSEILKKAIKQERVKLSEFFKYLEKLKIRRLDNYIRFHKDYLFHPLESIIDLSYQLLKILEGSSECGKKMGENLNKLIKTINMNIDCFKKVKIFQERAIVLNYYAKLIINLCSLAEVMKEVEDVERVGVTEPQRLRISDALNDVQRSIDILKDREDIYLFNNHTVSVDVLDHFNHLLIHILGGGVQEEIDQIFGNLKNAIENEGKSDKEHISLYNYFYQLYNDIMKEKNIDIVLKKYSDFPYRLNNCILAGILKSLGSFFLLALGRN